MDVQAQAFILIFTITITIKMLETLNLVANRADLDKFVLQNSLHEFAFHQPVAEAVILKVAVKSDTIYIYIYIYICA